MADAEVNEVLSYLSANEGRHYVSGWMEKQPIDHRNIFNRKWRRKWMELFPQLIAWYNEGSAVPRGYMLLPPTTIVRESAGKGSAIEVASTSGRTLRIRAADAQQHHVWLTALARAVSEEPREASQPTAHGWPTAAPPSGQMASCTSSQDPVPNAATLASSRDVHFSDSGRGSHSSKRRAPREVSSRSSSDRSTSQRTSSARDVSSGRTSCLSSHSSRRTASDVSEGEEDGARAEHSLRHSYLRRRAESLRASDRRELAPGQVASGASATRRVASAGDWDEDDDDTEEAGEEEEEEEAGEAGEEQEEEAVAAAEVVEAQAPLVVACTSTGVPLARVPWSHTSTSTSTSTVASTSPAALDLTGAGKRPSLQEATGHSSPHTSGAYATVNTGAGGKAPGSPDGTACEHMPKPTSRSGGESKHAPPLQLQQSWGERSLLVSLPDAQGGCTVTGASSPQGKGVPREHSAGGASARLKALPVHTLQKLERETAAILAGAVDTRHSPPAADDEHRFR